MLKVFDYIESLDCFVVNKDFKEICDYLGLSEWHEVVWIGRYFTLDNDYGEHWFDNWPEREALETKAQSLGYDSESLMVVDPERFRNGQDGPCHTDEEIKRFWTDVLESLHLSWDIISAEARKINLEKENREPDGYLPDLDSRILFLVNKTK